MGSDLERRLLELTDRFAQGFVDEALEEMAVLEQSCTTDKERSQVFARYVTFFHLLDLQEEELSALAQALALDPANPRANYLHALHLMADYCWDEAVVALNVAIRYYPQEDRVHRAEAYGNLSYCWEQLKDPARARMYEEIAAELDPEGVLTTPVEGLDDEDPGVEFLPASLEDEPELDLPFSTQISNQVQALSKRRGGSPGSTAHSGTGSPKKRSGTGRKPTGSSVPKTNARKPKPGGRT